MDASNVGHRSDRLTPAQPNAPGGPSAAPASSGDAPTPDVAVPTGKPARHESSRPRRRVAKVLLLGALVLAVGAGGFGVTLQGESVSRAIVGATRPPVTSLTPVARPEFRQPGYLVPVTDPVFGSTILRISDRAAFATDASLLRHVHARRQPWNSDGSLLLLGYKESGWLLDGRTYEVLPTRLPAAADGAWSNLDPQVFYSVRGNEFLRIDAATGAATVVRTFPDWESLSIGDGEGSPADDDSLALVARTGDRLGVIVYDPRGDVVVGERVFPDAAEQLDWAAVSQSGDGVVLNWLPDGTTPGTGVELYDRAMNPVRHLYPHSERGDLGVDEAGQDVYVTTDGVSGRGTELPLLVVAVRLSDGARTTVLRTDWVGTHVSCRNLDRPGWCYVSDSVADQPWASTGGFDEIFAVRLDGSQAVERFAHAHQSSNVPYDWTTMAVPSRDGRRVLWASDWLLGPSAPAYAYVASYGAPPSP